MSARADSAPAVFSGVLGDQRGDVAADATVTLFAANDCLRNAVVTSTTTAADGSFSLSVSPGTYDLYVELSPGIDPLFPGLQLCTPNVALTGDLVQNLTLPINRLTVLAQDSAGNPVPGATVQSSGFVTIPAFDLFPGQATNFQQEHTAAQVSDAQGTAVVPFLPLSTGGSTNLGVTPPTGSALSATTIATGAMQADTTVTATLHTPVAFSGVVQDQHGDVAAGMTVTLFAANDCLRNAVVTSTTTATDGSFFLSASPGAYDLYIELNRGVDTQFPGLELCTPNVILTGDLTQNLTLPVNRLTVLAQDSAGNPVPGATVQSSGFVTIQPLDVIPGQATNFQQEFTTPQTTDTQGTATVPFLPISTAGSTNLGVTPPTGSTLSATTIATGAMQADTTVTATLHTPVTFSGIVQDQHGDVAAGTTVTLFAANDCLRNATVATTTTATDGSFTFSVSPGTYDLYIELNPGVDPLFPGLQLCTPNLVLTGDLTQNLTLPVNRLTVLAQDSAGNPVPGATVQSSGFVTIQPLDVIPGQATNFQQEHTAAQVTDAQGTATVPFLPLSTNGSTNLGVTPPTGSALSPTTIATGPMQTDTTVTATMAGPVQAPTSTAITSSVNPSAVGQQVTFTATVSGGGSPTGTITFALDGAAQQPVMLNSGVATFTTSALAAGSHTVTAAYSGDAYHTASTSTALTQTVNQDTTTTALTTSVNPSVTGQGVIFTVTVTPTGSNPGTPTGSVIYTVDGTALSPVTLASGAASLTLANLTTASHTITAAYSGDSTYSASTSAGLTQTVDQADTTTTLASSANPALVGQPGEITATVAPVAPGAGTPTGTVTFTLDGAAQTPTALASGTATLDLSTLPPGTHTITATYSGDAGYSPSTSNALSQTINQASATVTLGSSANPSVTGQPVVITASVAPLAPATSAPTGTVTFTVDGTAQSPITLASGTATLALPALVIGAHSVTAAYSGDTTYAAAASDVLTQTVDEAATSTTLTSSQNPSSNGHPITFTATVSALAPGGGAPTGTVVFTVDGIQQNPAMPLSAGTASLTLSTLSPGTHTLIAAYQGSTSYAASTSATLTQTVAQPTATSTTLTVSPSGTVTFGTSATLTAAEAPTTGGSVQFLDGATAFGAPIPVSGGSATYTTTALPIGTHTLTAVFTPTDPAYTASTSTPASLRVIAPGIAVDQTIAKAGTGTVTTPTFSTTGPRLLVAFTSSDGPATKQTTTLTGAGLTWTLAQRANSKGGTAEIWTAYATGPLTNVTATSTPKTAGYAQLLTVEVFTGATGVGAGATAGKAGGTPIVSVTTTTANSWVFGVAENYTHATAPTPGANQTVLQQYLDTVNADTFWVQDQNAVTPTAGAKITINDTAPTGDTWNLAAVEILPAS